ncbi:hypothetical protein DVK00_14640 [Haloarcula sp. Atlit-47R]|uniref:hypothetical protein n=2 Tax=Haloarculaceae TaxID=1963268 RepID=UPI000EF1AC7F|nr:hypothetical protein [Haloarcula sp. Atlit-47R]RLM44277.1 hypothetical protein DVK00_14640 [Haloarcula sp. Atlit-47R]
MVIYFSLLTIFGLSYLGLFQLFPDNEKMDPHRFMSRALAATLSLFIVNPPGTGTLFSRGPSRGRSRYPTRASICSSKASI